MATTARGHIEKLPSGSFRVHVYAGTDPVTGKPRRLKQTCPDEAAAAAALGQMLSEADGDRFPNRQATLGKYLEVADLEVSRLLNVRVERSYPGAQVLRTVTVPPRRVGHCHGA
jgi:hypothetical protein